MKIDRSVVAVLALAPRLAFSSPLNAIMEDAYQTLSGMLIAILAAAFLVTCSFFFFWQRGFRAQIFKPCFITAIIAHFIAAAYCLLKQSFFFFFLVPISLSLVLTFAFCILFQSLKRRPLAQNVIATAYLILGLLGLLLAGIILFSSADERENFGSSWPHVNLLRSLQV